MCSSPWPVQEQRCRIVAVESNRHSEIRCNGHCRDSINLCRPLEEQTCGPIEEVCTVCKYKMVACIHRTRDGNTCNISRQCVVQTIPVTSAITNFEVVDRKSIMRSIRAQMSRCCCVLCCGAAGQRRIAAVICFHRLAIDPKNVIHGPIGPWTALPSCHVKCPLGSQSGGIISDDTERA